MVRARRWVAALVLVLAFWGLNSSVFGETNSLGTVIQSVEVQGNRRIESSTILSKIRSRAGELLSAETVREDIKAIHQMGHFSEVGADTLPAETGLRLIFKVVERPFLVDFDFLGNQEILSDKLKEQVSIKTPTVLDELHVKEAAASIKRYYEQEGYYNTRVIPVIRKKDEDRVTLSFYITEGAQAKIREIRFEGNRAIPKKRLLKAAESSVYSGLYSWMSGGGLYKKDVQEGDVDRIKEEYLNEGYVQVQVGMPVIGFTDREEVVSVPVPLEPRELDFSYDYRETSVSVSFSIIEGEQFYLRKVEFSGNSVFSADELLALMKLKEGDLFRRNRLRESISAIHDSYGEKGYIYANVIPQFDPKPNERKVDLIIQIREDNQMTVRRVGISGNDKTRDKVIRREIRVEEQEIANMKLLRRSFQRINNLNFFESIELLPERIDADHVDLNVRLKEKPTGSLSIGGGYSSVDGAIALAQITEGNLFGRGQLLRAQAELGRRRTTYSLTFREPYLFDYNVSGTLSGFNQERDFDTYKERRLGGSAVLGKSFTEYVSGSLSYTREKLNIFDVDQDDPDTDDVVEKSAPALVIEQEGASVTSSVGTTLAYDTRDFSFDPKEGGRYAVSAEIAGNILGGTNEFFKGVLDARQYFPVFWDTVFSLHGRFGYATGMNGESLPVGERFFVGGINTVRGFKFGRAGPLSDSGEIQGGNRELIFNAEFLFPLVAEAKIKGVLFADTGRGFDDEERIQIDTLRLRYSAGFGIRWISPIGPLRLEWGRNLNPRDDESATEVEFTIGTLF